MNSEGFTFFDLATKNRKKEVCIVAMKHARWREILSTLSPIYPSPIFGLIEELPDVCLFVLEKFVSSNNKSILSKDLAVSFVRFCNCSSKKKLCVFLLEKIWGFLSEVPGKKQLILLLVATSEF